MALYYVANAGNDGDPGTLAAPWQTVAKVNGEAFLPGDSILFNRGDLWREQLTVPSSGLAGSPITFGAYGGGADPIIKGSEIFAAWTVIPAAPFSDDFNTGDLTGWDATEEANGTVSASVDEVFEGSHALKAAIVVGGGSAYVVENNLNAGNHYWVTARMFFPLGFNVGGNTELIKITEAGGAFNTVVLGINAGNQLYILNPHDGWAVYTAPNPITTNQWLAMRLHIHIGNSGQVRLWIDESLEINQNVDTFSGQNYAFLRVGIDAWGANTPTVYYDYVRCNDNNNALDPSAATGYYKTGITTQPNDAFWNDDTRLVGLVSGNIVYHHAYHLYDGDTRMGYDDYTDICYIRCPADANPATGTVELGQRDQCILVNARTYCNFENLAWSHANDADGGGLRLRVGGNHIVRDCEGDLNADSGISMEAASTDNIVSGGSYDDNYRQGIVIYQSDDNIVDGIGGGGTLVITLGMIFVQESDDCVVRDCSLTSTRGFGIDGLDSDNLTIQGNTIADSQTGIWIEGTCADYLIERNTVTNARNPANANDGGINVNPSAPGVCNGTIRYNWVEDCENGIQLNSSIADDALVHYNIILDTKAGSAQGDIWVGRADSVQIYNNACINGGGDGIKFSGWGGDRPSNCTVRNNIVYGCTGVCLNVDADTVNNGVGNTFDYNDYYKAAGNIISWAGVVYTAATFGNYQVASGQDAQSITGDPLLTDVATEDFTLQAGSPCRNVGVDVGLTRDYGGILIPQETNPAIGAYEYRAPGASAGTILQNFPSPIGIPTGIAWDGRALWIASTSLNTIGQVDPVTGTLIRSFPVPVGQGEVRCLTWDGRALWFTVTWPFDLIYQLDPVTGTAIRNFASPVLDLYGITWDGRALWITAAGMVYQLDPVTGTAIRSYLTLPQHPSCITWDGRTLWYIGYWTNEVYQVDPITGTVIQYFDTPDIHCTGICWDGRTLWIVSSTSQIYQVAVN